MNSSSLNISSACSPHYSSLNRTNIFAPYQDITVISLGLSIGYFAITKFLNFSEIWQRTIQSYQKIDRSKNRQLIYQKNFKTFIFRFDSMLANLCKNPNDSHSLKKFESLILENASLFKPYKEKSIENYQIKKFKILKQKVSLLPPSVRNKLIHVLQNTFAIFFESIRPKGFCISALTLASFIYRENVFWFCGPTYPTNSAMVMAGFGIKRNNFICERYIEV